MLRKLLKYEMKATARLFLPLYSALLIFALISRFLNPFQSFDTSGNFNLQAAITIFSGMVYFALIIGVIVMTLLIMIQRFYKNLLGDEGYLMFTLPVKSWMHIVCKLLVSLLWTILSLLIVICSILIIVDTKEIFKELPNIINALRGSFGNAGFIIIPLYALIATASSILVIYDSIAIGHLFTEHKLLASFGMYCVFYVIYQTMLVIFIFLFSNTRFANLIVNAAPTPSDLNMFILALTFISALFVAGHLTLTNIILKKRLNLE